MIAGFNTLARWGLIMSCVVFISDCHSFQFDKKADIYLVISIDVEALPERAPSNHVERLIYGDFGEAHREGIEEMMDAADHAGVQISFFLDVLEVSRFPQQIAEVAKRIVARGHDVELHAHPDNVPAEFWSELGIPPARLVAFTRSDAAALFGYAHRLFETWKLPQPVAFRGGGYEQSRGLIEAMPDAKLAFSYNYNPRGTSQAHNFGRLPMFTWTNGVIEIPISYVPHAFGDVRFDDNLLNDVPGMYKEIEDFGRAEPDVNVLVMMMHSWSFLDLDGQYRVYGGDRRCQQFERFLQGLPANVHVVTARQLQQLFDNGTLARPPTFAEAWTLFP